MTKEKPSKPAKLPKGISVRPDGRFCARATIQGTKICLYDTNLSKLKKRFEEEKAKVLRKEHNVRPNLTLADWAAEWFETHKRPSLKTETSRATYFRRLKNTYVEILGSKKVEALTQNNIQLATNELLEKGYKQRTVREALGMLKECLDVATVNNLCRVNPCVRISMPNNTEAVPERRILDNYELSLMMDVIRGDVYEEVYKIMLSSGMRVGEMSALQWKDVDFDNKVIRIRRSMSIGYVEGKKMEVIVPPKTTSGNRDIPFFPETEALFKSWKEKQDAYKKKLGSRWRARPELGDLVFTTTLGSPLSRYAFAHSIEKVEKNMQEYENYKASTEDREPRIIEHIHAHVLRHNFCTRCFEKGMNYLLIQKIMGHSSLQSTMIYLHIMNEKRQEEIDKLGNFF